MNFVMARYLNGLKKEANYTRLLKNNYGFLVRNTMKAQNYGLTKV